jgi:predicted dehydrogenase
MKHLVIGGGSIGKRHLKNLLSINETDIYCLRREANDHFDFEFSCRTLVRNEITDFGEFDAIFICTPSNLHFTNLKDIIENTSKPIHILIEKPFFISTEEFKFLKDNNNKKIKHFMGFMLRFHPCIAKIKNLIETDFLELKRQFDIYILFKRFEAL